MKKLNKHTIKITAYINTAREYIQKMNQEEILGRIRPYLGEEARIKVELVDEIPVLASGKRKYIENRCEKYQDHKGICG